MGCKGELWLRTPDKNRWMHGVCSMGEPRFVDPPIDKTHFSGTGLSLLLTSHVGSTIAFPEPEELRTLFCRILRSKHWSDLLFRPWGWSQPLEVRREQRW